MEYRKEIDGLRAVAVIPVILFHAGFDLFSGGFVGVDIFFVISGYLITTVILAEKEKGSFSLINFYERRARRILPALFFVMLVCIPFAWFWLSPSDHKDFSQSLVSVSLFSSNILFWQESGYFAAAAEMKPLLHTWSLAVEEQYYVLFPLFLMLVWRYRKRWIFGAIILLGVVSLLLAQWGAYNKPTATFFLLPTRAWELMIGASAAFYILYGEDHVAWLTKNKFLNEMFGLLGVILIFISVFVFNKYTPFPSAYALIPTIGTALIILFSSKDTFVGRALGRNLLVGVGLLSYSLYLWHQPLFAFARHRSMGALSAYDYTVLILLVFIFAYLTWRYIEGPFRNKAVTSRFKVFSFVIIGSVFFIVVGLLGHSNDGFMNRYSPKFTSYLLGSDDKNPNQSQCVSNDVKYLPPNSACSIGDSENIKGVLLGDSHSDAAAYSLGNSLKKNNIGLKHMWYVGCPAILGLYRKNSKMQTRCNEYYKAAYAIISNDNAMDNVVLISRFTIYIEGDRFNNGEGGIETGDPVFIDGIEFKGKIRNEKQRKNIIMERYVNSIKTLLDLGKNIILVYPIPEVGWVVPTYAAKSFRYYGNGDVSTSYEKYLKRNAKAFTAFDAIGEHMNLKRIYPHKILCDTYIKERCIATLDGHSLYFDDDHLSNFGAQLIVDEIVSKMR